MSIICGSHMYKEAVIEFLVLEAYALNKIQWNLRVLKTMHLQNNARKELSICRYFLCEQKEKLE